MGSCLLRAGGGEYEMTVQWVVSVSVDEKGLEKDTGDSGTTM